MLVLVGSLILMPSSPSGQDPRSKIGPIGELYTEPLYQVNGPHQLHGYAFISQDSSYSGQLVALLFDQPNGPESGSKLFITLYFDRATMNEAGSFPGLLGPDVPLKDRHPVTLHAQLRQGPSGGIAGTVNKWGDREVSHFSSPPSFNKSEVS